MTVRLPAVVRVQGWLPKRRIDSVVALNRVILRPFCSFKLFSSCANLPCKCFSGVDIPPLLAPNIWSPVLQKQWALVQLTHRLSGLLAEMRSRSRIHRIQALFIRAGDGARATYGLQWIHLYNWLVLTSKINFENKWFDESSIVL